MAAAGCLRDDCVTASANPQFLYTVYIPCIPLLPDLVTLESMEGRYGIRLSLTLCLYIPKSRVFSVASRVHQGPPSRARPPASGAASGVAPEPETDRHLDVRDREETDGHLPSQRVSAEGTRSVFRVFNQRDDRDERDVGGRFWAPTRVQTISFADSQVLMRPDPASTGPLEPLSHPNLDPASHVTVEPAHSLEPIRATARGSCVQLDGL